MKEDIEKKVNEDGDICIGKIIAETNPEKVKYQHCFNCMDSKILLCYISRKYFPNYPK